MGTWLDTTTLVTNVRNFPNDRGFVVGVLKSFLGLSSSIYTSVYIAGRPHRLMLCAEHPAACV